MTGAKAQASLAALYDGLELRHWEPGTVLASYDFAGLDRFGRVKDHRWDDTGSSADFARVKYGYDFASNRTWREDVVAAANSKDHDEFYAYDELHRLKAFDRGNLTGTAPNYTGIAGTPSRGEDFVLDQMGNWTTYQVSTSGPLTLNQTRGHNSANEVSTATSWQTSLYDDAGNMTTMPRPHIDRRCPTDSLGLDGWRRILDSSLRPRAFAGSNLD